MSVATSSTSWRSTRVRRRPLVVVEVRWRADRDFGLPEETVDHASGPGSGRRRTASSTAGRLPDGAGLPRLPLRFDLVVVEPPRAGGPSAPRVRHHRRGLLSRRRPGQAPDPVLHSRPVREP